MLEAEYITGNPLTGRQVWLARHLLEGEPLRGKWDWSVLIIRRRYFSKTAFLMGLQGKFARQGIVEIRELLEVMGFTKATSLRHSTKKQWS